MTPDVAMQIHGVTQIVSQTNLSEETGKPFWKWAKGGKFTVKCYLQAPVWMWFG
jgi:hypothetical protein